MQPVFNIKREKNDRLFIRSYANDYCWYAYQFHSQIELYFIDQGEMDIFVGGRSKRLSAGQLSVALSYEVHDYKTVGESKSSVLLIPCHLCKEFVDITAGKRLKDPFITDPVLCEKIRACYDALKEEKIDPLRQQGYLYVILGLILENIPLEDVSEPLDHNLASEILLYISDNFQNDFTCASVSKHFGYSESYISHFFKACFGITLCKYIILIKLRNTVMLMQEEKYDISTCALESGFSSARSFYRAFSKEFGCSPKEYLHQTKLN